MSQIKTKYMENDAVTDLKFKLQNNGPLRARNAANSADLNLLKVTSGDVLQLMRQLDGGAFPISNVQDPTNAQDVATKNFVMSVLSGVSDPKDAVKVATTGPLPSLTYSNGAGGVGATLTASANGALPNQDGVALSVSDRILVKDQVAGLQNGIYVVTQVGDASHPFILTRSSDANGSSVADGITQGMFTIAAAGSTLAQQGFMLTTADPITIGTTALAFAKFGEVTIAGNGITKTGTTLSVTAGNGLTFSGSTLIVSIDPAALALATTKFLAGAIVSLRAFKEVFTLGSADITNQYIDLSKVAHTGSLEVQPVGAPPQREGADYNANYTGGTGSKTRISLSGDLATGGNAALASGDVVEIKYESLDY